MSHFIVPMIGVNTEIQRPMNSRRKEHGFMDQNYVKTPELRDLTCFRDSANL